MGCVNLVDRDDTQALGDPFLRSRTEIEAMTDDQLEELGAAQGEVFWARTEPEEVVSDKIVSFLEGVVR
jgi:hypothetical protein